MLNVTGDGSITAGGALNGGAGNDSFHAVSTTQVINGGGGQDAVTFTRVSAPLTLALQGDNVLLNGDTSPHVVGVQDVTGGSGNDTLIGSAPPGGSGPLTLRGGPGNNIFVPMGGPENIIGAPGNTMNTVSYAYLPDSTPLTVDLSNGTGGPTGASDQQDSLTNIQGVIGNNGTDNITGGSQGGSFMLGNGATTMTGGPENDTIQAGSGTDNIDGGGGNDTILGGSGNDTLVGGPGNNHIQAGSGTTVLEDSGGDNTLVGGSGNDTVSYANRTRDQGVIVSLNGTAGSSNNGQPGENDTITGIENIIGSAGDDILNGDSNANNIQAGSGNPVINGGDGNDTIVGGSGNDTITDGKGVDTITTGNGDNLVTANSAPGSVLNCGSGFNNVTVSTSVVTNNCQLVTILGEKAFVPPPTLINASLGKVSARKFKEGFTIFKRLDVDNVPGQTSVSITCQTLSNLCPKNNPAAYNFNSGKRTVHLIKFLKSISYEVPGKTTLTILVTGGPNTIGREFVIKTGKHGGVQKTIQTCLKPRTVESAATTTTGFSTSGGGLKTQKCPPKAAFDSNRAVRANARRHTRPETQQQRQQADATFALATAQIRALAARDAAALALVK
jgi:Ca2+-binding RTX toxin-like protein